MFRVALVVGMAACRPPETDGSSSVPPSVVQTDLAATCAPNAVVPAVLDCSFTSSITGVPTVEYWPADDAADVRVTPPGPAGTAHNVAVMGLKAGRTYEYRAVVSGDERVTSIVRTHTVPLPPADFADLTLVVSDPDKSEVANGYVVVAIAHITGKKFTEVNILDGDGDRVWWVRSVDNGLSISPVVSLDGRSIHFLTTDQTWSDDIGTINRISLTGDEVEETRALLGHHASVENSDGTLSWISFVYDAFGSVQWASDAIRTVAEGSDETVSPTLEFSWFDAYDALPWEDVPGETDMVRYGDGIEWTHSNSLMAIDDDYYYISAKNVDKLLKIDRSTGSVVWQMNGWIRDPSIPHFTNPDGTEPWRSTSDLDLWSHSHMSHIWDGGMVVFDNGDLSNDPPYNRAVEYAFDEQELTVRQVWEYIEPQRRYTGAMGDVRKLESGNYLIAWSGLEYMNEVTPDGEVVWQVEMKGVGTFGRVLPLSDIYPP